MPLESIAIASDHAGFELKNQLAGTLGERGYQVLDLGTDGTDPVDYPDYANAMNEAFATGQATRGVLVCGSGIGISIAANRHPRIRAALVHDAFGARQCREHNDANVICFGGRTIEAEVARDCLDIFLETQFAGGRHASRVSKLAAVPTT
ncbi:MAG: ribose 5-phosphate isomerase B [Rhodospirillales bacterium]|jgi:ribose 5-phosphate isomerase B|nr:ribose 5-phosphate isomerase B [Rhodospirillales bacterium]